MILKKICTWTLAVAACLATGVLLHSAETEGRTAPVVETLSPSAVSTNRLVAGEDDGRIVYVAARMIEQGHYLRPTFDDAYSEQFFNRYIDALDPQHIHFTEADIEEFEHYTTTLDDLTLSRRGMADTSPAYVIFDRFLTRLQQRTEYADDLLAKGGFDFTTDERVQLDRRKSPFPADLTEARKLWGQRVRYEYLQERLSLAAERKSAAAKEGKSSDAQKPDVDAKPKEDAQEKTPAKSDDEQIVEKLTRRYDRNLRMFKDFGSDEVLQVYLTALAQTYDPHSDYMNKRQADNFAIGMNLSLFGIGAELRFDDGYCVIQKLHPGPAAKSKQIREGDKIIAVAQGDESPVDIVEMQLSKAVQLIRGPKGTEVRLTVIPAENSSERRIVSLVRDEIKLEDQAAKAKIVEFTNTTGKPLRLGVLDLPSFYSSMNINPGTSRPEPRSTTDDVARLIKKLEQEKVEGIILDLRRNGGGSLEEAIRLTGLFIKQGPVVQVYAGPGEGVFVDGDDDPEQLYDGPLIVLTSRFSASASEILAGALQDYGRALIVGDISTHGKGTVQNVNPLTRWIKNASTTNDPGMLKLTIRKFYRASGASTQLKGVLPDIVLPSVLNHSKEIGEASLDNALAWDVIPGARYDRYRMVESYLPELLKRSSKRIETDREFDYIREDIERYRKLQAEKTISLNEAERLREMDEDDARKKSRDKERLARKDAKPAIYEIKLADVDKPGLPAAVGATNSVADTELAVSPQSGETNELVGVTTQTLEVADVKPRSRGEFKADDDDEEEKAPSVDAMLEEAERILADYIQLMSPSSPVVVNR